MRYQTLPVKPETKKLIDELYLKLRKEKSVKSYDAFILAMFRKFEEKIIKNERSKDSSQS